MLEKKALLNTENEVAPIPSTNCVVRLCCARFVFVDTRVIIAVLIAHTPARATQSRMRYQSPVYPTAQNCCRYASTYLHARSRPPRNVT
jgi:hypothetical protein